ncbi:MAG: RNA-splicing ligase RtcB [Candidatus Doudnabacteria bacterium RIFCSPHIGHO2_01_52_17]|uniref:tRNA-splicing ligase RtcB n=1 Tax=Candidatus Doudnabacteria bacterium RIFCSPHIGHO2_01_52_17 TaxID=1817820 RepID=A0A1F5NDL9_9BACT|nr:MAG: RNA-splicing ligase RtcB [Candidatus Doudnabacteria bacterium RIFCSPHIGHO2_01_52_17]
MITKSDLKQLSPVLWQIPREFRRDMRVPAEVFANSKILEQVFRDKSLEQLVNVSTLPGIVRAALLMPDAHEGYGFPIGGVAAMDMDEGVISPGGIGYDINCGVRLLVTKMVAEEIQDTLPDLARGLYRMVPSGVGASGRIRLDDQELDEVLKGGVDWATAHGYGTATDAGHIESHGQLPNADPAAVSAHAKNRGRDQLGTMGAGNHFVEIGKVERIFDPEIARDFGLFSNQVTILIHCGSRGLGHQIATDYIRVMLGKLQDYGIDLPDRELACAPFQSPEGQRYFAAMTAAANFAWANRQIITDEVRQVWREVLGESGGEISILYDVAHNIAKIEEHVVGGIVKKLVVHRKGATRSFGPNHPELLPIHQKTGQPVLIPGSMGTASYVLAGTETAMKMSFGSSCHGAGRRMSRHQALREVSGKALREELGAAGIFVETGSVRGLAEEAPFAYKDIHDVVGVVAEADLARKVAQLKPLAVIKG